MCIFLILGFIIALVAITAAVAIIWTNDEWRNALLVGAGLLLGMGFLCTGFYLGGIKDYEAALEHKQKIEQKADLINELGITEEQLRLLNIN